MIALNDFFELRGDLTKKENTKLFIFGLIFFISIWFVVTKFKLVSPGILPSPFKVLFAFPELHFDDALVRNAGYSIFLNILAYIEAIAISLPIGFIIGLNKYARGIFEPYIASTRYLPLSALTGLFIAWFGIYSNMKVQFLAFGIFVYLVAAVIQRIDDVERVYTDTVRTLGASKLQEIRYVYIPAVTSRVWSDIKVLLPLSWTYIIIAETMNSSSGGIGALSYIAARQSRTDKVYALLLVIILIAFIADRSAAWIDKILFAYKYGSDN